MYTTRVTRHINAAPEAVYRALLDAELITKWRVPSGVTGHVHEFEGSKGGAYRISLTYQAPDSTGTMTTQTNTYHGHFEELVPNEKVVEVFEFEMASPGPSSPMTMTTVLTEAAGGTEVLVVHEGIPDALPADQSEASTRTALDQLAGLVEAG